MKKVLKKIMLTPALIISLLAVTLVNTNISKAEETNHKLVAVEPGISRTLKESVKKSTYNKLMTSNEDDNSSYNLAENYTNLTVKNQQQIGSCWAFAYTSMVESTLKNNKEYSPMHVEYKTAEMFNRKLGSGGSFLMAMSYSGSSYGPVLESELPFDSVYNEETNSLENSYLLDMSEVSYNDCDVSARVEDMMYFPSIYKTYNADESITYRNSDYILRSETYSEDEVNAIRNLIKQHIKTYGGVMASFYSDFGITASDEIISASGCYNTDTAAFYSESSSLLSSPNHAVTIVGWDDSYSKDNFTEGKEPKNDGAYIVLNSYGSEFGKNGYFYVSYDDFAIEQSIVGASKITEVEENSSAVKYNYEYDELGMSDGIGFAAGFKPVGTLYAANVFSKQDNTHNEKLTEVGLYLGSAQGVKIYVNSEDGDISKCTTEVANYTGDNALEAGYHVIKLSSPVELVGDNFVVKVEYINSEDGAYIPLEYDHNANGSDGDPEELFNNATSKQGESYFSVDNSKYYDLYTYTGEVTGETNVTYKDSNVCIKAFTVQSEERVSVTGVSLDKDSETLQVGDKTNLVATITPTNATNTNVVWESSDSSVVTVSEGGIINAIAEGTATIKVTTKDGNYTDECTITVTKKTNTEDDIYQDDNGQTGNNDQDDNGLTGQEGNNVNKDGTQANSNLPDTGVKSKIMIISISFVVVLFIYKKYKKYKDIK